MFNMNVPVALTVWLMGWRSRRSRAGCRQSVRYQPSCSWFLLISGPCYIFIHTFAKTQKPFFFWKWKYYCDGIISVSNILFPHLTAHVLSSTVFPVGWSDTEHTYNKCQYSDCHIKAWELLSVSFHPCFIRSHTVSAFVQGWTKWGCTQHTRFKKLWVISSTTEQSQTWGRSCSGPGMKKRHAYFLRLYQSTFNNYAKI